MDLPEIASSTEKSVLLQEAFIALAKYERLWVSDLDTALAIIVKRCSEVIGVERASVWQMNDERTQIICLVMYCACSDSYHSGTKLSRCYYPAYFDAIDRQRVIDAHEAATDTRTNCFNDDYLSLHGISSLLDAGIRWRGRTMGVLCMEHAGKPRTWKQEEQSFSTSVADLISQLKTFHLLRDGERRYRTLFSSSADSLFVLKDGHFIECNAAAVEMFRCRKEQLIGAGPADVSPRIQPDGQLSETKAREKVSAALAGIPQTFEWRHCRFDGSTFDTEVRLNAIRLEGEFLLIGSVRDVTERKQDHDRIRELNTFQEAILDGATYGIISTDVKGTIRSFNKAAEKMLGYRAEELVDREKPDILHLRSEIEARAAELGLDTTQQPDAISRVLTEKASKGHVEEREWTYVRKDGTRFPALVSISALHDDVGTVTGYLGICSDITERKQAEEALHRSRLELEYRANHDLLTGLPNRESLHQVVRARLGEGAEGPSAIMLLDLDRFKEVNDTLGHHTGDEVLKSIGRRIDAFLEERGAQAFRLGGDEFALYIPDLANEQDACTLAFAVNECLRQPIEVEGITLELRGSIGIALYPNHGVDSHALLRCADVAMYAAKSQSTGVGLYDPSLDSHSPRRLRLMAELGAAIRRNQLILHYQPIVEVKTRRCVACEALLRWHHPQLGMILPEEFVPLAEMSDVIRPMSMWVARTALGDLEKWRQGGIDLRVAINLSARNLMDLSCAEGIEELVARMQVPAHCLEVEITESALIHDPERALSVIAALSNIGLGLTIDDFGTGFSSLSYLKRLPINKLKVDRTFVMDMVQNEPDAVIVRSTIALAHSFGLAVVAEGVEDERTLKALSQTGCGLAQGFLFSPALPANEFAEWYRTKGCGEVPLRG